MQASFWKAGHPPTLFAAFLYFDVSFMVWVLLGPLGVQIAQTLQISPAEKGLMVATPVLAGAFLRVVLGLMVDRLGPKLTGIIGQIVVMAALAAAWLIGLSAFWQVMLLGIFLGVAGASFAVALPLASRWYPPEHQGTALGIAGAGNSGTVFAALFAPTLAAWYGWNSVFGLALIPLGIAFILFLVMAKDSPDAPPPKSFKEYLAVLREVDAWWFMFFYSVTFGGFVGLASSLTIYFNDVYGMGPVEAGYFTAACVFMGSAMRPVGGYLADRIGGIKSLSIMYAMAATFLIIVSFGLAQAWMALIVFACAMQALGMGNGAVFQLGAPALPAGDRRHDRSGRDVGRHRRLLSGLQPGPVEAVVRQLSGGLPDLRGPGAAGPVRSHRRQERAGGRPGVPRT